MGGEYRPLNKRHEGSRYPRGEKGAHLTPDMYTPKRNTTHNRTKSRHEVHRFNEQQPQVEKLRGPPKAWGRLFHHEEE